MSQFNTSGRHPNGKEHAFYLTVYKPQLYFQYRFLHCTFGAALQSIGQAKPVLVISSINEITNTSIKCWSQSTSNKTFDFSILSFYQTTIFIVIFVIIVEIIICLVNKQKHTTVAWLTPLVIMYLN